MKFKNILLTVALFLLTAVFCNHATAATVAYTYDNLNRLKRVDYGNGTAIDYTYDASGNRRSLVSVSSGGGMGDTIPPVGTISINGGAVYTKSASVTLSLLAADNSGSVTSMQFSNDNVTWSGWELYAQTKSWTLASGDGTKTVYVQFKDGADNVSPNYSATVTVDSTAPVDGTLTVAVQNSSVSLSWPGFTDSTSGIKAYKLVYGTAGAPAHCNEGMVIYTGSAASHIHVRLANGTVYGYRLCALDKAGNVSSGATATATPVAPTGISAPDYTIQGIARSDDGQVNNNLDPTYNVPRIDIEYEFGIILKDPTGNPPQYARLFMTDRTTPLTTDFYSVDLSCDLNWSNGAYCSYPTLLAPAANHKYYFEAKLANGTVMRYPGAGTLDGPVVELLNGRNMVGAPRDLALANLDGSMAFGSSLTYKWVSSGPTDSSNKGSYVLIDANNPVKPGEGYFIVKSGGFATLPELELYNDVLDLTYAVALKPGWNMVSNPYGGNVKLSSVKIKKGNATPVTWASASTSGWMVNAIYFYKGSDWGSAYTFESAGGNPDATLVPWLGYWVYLNKADGEYSFIIPRP